MNIDYCYLENVIDGILLLRYVFVHGELLGRTSFMHVVVVEIRLGYKEYPYFIPLTRV